MRPKLLSKKILTITILAGLAFFVSFLFYPIPQMLPQDRSAASIENATTLQQQEHSGLPMRLTIPNIQVDAPIEHVGLTSEGAMDVPKSPDNVAWFEPGPYPGETGSSVIAGHYGWKNNIPAIFDNLHALRIGDKLYIENGKGEITIFVVREMKTYDKNADASDVFGSSDGKAHLNLITCAGAWDEAEKSYGDRLIVFADKE